MAVITLTTDWGTSDPYAAAFKGLLLRRLPGVQIVDVTHSIKPHDRLSAAYVVANTYGYFPEGTVHFIGMNSLEGAKSGKGSDYLIVEAEGQLMMGADCGIFAMVLENRPYKLWRLPVPESADQEELQLFLLESAVQLLRGTAPSRLAEPHDRLQEAYFTKPVSDSSGIRGSVIFIDSFGNVVFNITRSFFEETRLERNFSILLRRAYYKLQIISKRFDTVPDGELMAYFNQDGYLEVAINKGNAAQLVGLKLFDPVLIEFYDNANRENELPAGSSVRLS
jgi:S-adenosylmethionine hydrolase